MDIAEQLRLLRNSDIIPDADTPIDPESGMDIEPYRLLDMAIDIVEEHQKPMIPIFRQDGKERDPKQLDSSWDSHPRDPLTDAQLRDVYPKDYDNDPPQDDKNDNHVREYNVYQIDQEHEQDLTTSLGDLLDEATEDKPDYSFFSDMTPEQLGKKGWTWRVGKGMVRKPKPCCPKCHQELWWE